MNKKLVQRIGPAIGIALFTVALFVLHRELKAFHYHQIVSQLNGFSRRHLLLAVLVTALDYLVLTGYDTLAFRYISRPFPYRRIALASFVSYAFSHNFGVNWLTGGSVRFRLYSAWRLSIVDIVKIIAFCSLTFWIGFLTVGGVDLVAEPMVLPASFHIPFSSARYLGIFFLVLIAAYLALACWKKEPVKIRDWEFGLPPLRLCFAQVGLASVDWCLAGFVLYLLLPPEGTLSYTGFLGIFLLSQIAGLISNIPAGLGVFETVILLFLSANHYDTPAVLASLVVYRGVYYLLPLAVAAVFFGIHEGLERLAAVGRMAQFFGRWVSAITPQVLAFTTFVGGAILLLSGATPAVGTRLAWLGRFLPLPVLEVSHFLGSLAGVGLLFLARGIQRRIDAAYYATALLLAAGAVFSLLKGLDYEEAVVLAAMLAVLLPCHKDFYRKASLFTQRFTVGWAAAIVLVLVAMVWLDLFTYKHVEYRNDLWWHFSLRGDAPRALRASVAVIGVALFFGLSRLLRPSPRAPVYPDDAQLDKAGAVIAASPSTFAYLALLGDKYLLFSEKENAFIMYGIQARSWVAMGDPVGPPGEITELAWRFREICDRHGGWTVFYEVEEEHLHVYIDLGLTLVKLGEEARVPLVDFSLDGRSRKSLRHTLNKLADDGCSFAVIPPGEVPPLIPELRTISDTWLAEKNTREKGFSLGFFDEKYLKRFPVGILRKGEKGVAFANLLPGAGKEELSVDLMRYVSDAPQGTMSGLLTHLMLWGRQEGYRWFNLGMAPLAGLQDHALAPLWNRVGAMLFRYGEHFYNFQGVREFKEKFDPVWRPRFLASPGGLALPRILFDLSSLISRGLKGVVTK